MKMPPKRSGLNKTGSKDGNELKRTKHDSQLSETRVEDISLKSEKTYLLKKEKSTLLSKLQKTKKDLADKRASVKDLEFKVLQDPQRKEDKFSELSKNVEIWSETMGMSIEKVTFSNSDTTREWFLQGAFDGLQFSIKIFCGTNEETKKGYVINSLIECSEPCKQELQPWLDNTEGNIEQIFKLFKAYSEMNKARETGINNCKNEFEDIISISRGTSGEIVLELGTENAFYFQIKWKLIPSIKHFAKIKNVCRIACTQYGDKYIKANTDLKTIKNELSHSPINVIKMLATGLVNLNATKKNGHTTDAEKGER